jgi:hypothetical protein
MSELASGALGGAATGAKIGSAIGPWGTAIGGAVGLVAGAIGGISASKARKKAQQQANKIAREDLAFRKQVYGEEQRLYGPLKQRLVGEAMSSEPLDYAQISGRIRENYANALRRINETSGIGAARSQSARLKMATELAGAHGQGLANRRNLGLAVSGRDQTIPLAMNVSGGYQNIQRMAENEAAIQGQQAAANWGAAASGLGQLIYGVSQMNSQPPPPPNKHPNTRYLMQSPSSTAAQMGVNPYGQIPGAPATLELPRYSMTDYGLTGGK